MSIRSILCYGLLLCALLPAMAQARDRPGTPNGGYTGYCANNLKEEPAMCVEFRNTATEEVGFLMDWTENGQHMQSDLRGRSECRSGTAQFYYCRALQSWFLGDSHVTPADHVEQLINPTVNPRFSNERDYPQGFRVKGLLYDSEYCFRFRSITRYAVISGDWSGFTCARTPPPPPPPGPLVRPKVTAILPTSGAGAVGAATPFKLLVEWQRPQAGMSNVGWYAVELWKDQRWIPAATLDPLRVNDGADPEALVEGPILGTPAQRQAVRVCTANIQSKVCSPEAWYYGQMTPKDRITDEPNQMAHVGPAAHTTVTAAPIIGAHAASALNRTAANYNTGAAIAAAAATPATRPPDLNLLAARGAELAAQDPLATELRNRTAEGAIRRGFDVGFGIWEGNSAPGPGKQQVHDRLSPPEQPGFDIAAAYALPRNKYAALANVGAAIGNADAELATARNAENDVFFWLGFDIASGIFGDPAAGAQGNTATGPGSLGIRNELNAAGQRGFNASTALHLNRKYR